MSEPIIIRTPAPDTEERLVLVPPESCTPVFDDGKQTGLSVRAQGARDATPADLERGGWVPLSAFVGPLGLLSPPTLAGALEAVEGIRQDADRWEHLESEQRSRVTSYLEERDEAVERAEKAEGLLIQRETELRLAREDGDERARDLRQAYERAVAAAEKAERELATERYEHGYTLTSRDMIHNKLAQAERERDEAKAGHNAVQADLAETVHERDTLRAELARLTAPGEGEPTDEELRAVHGRACGGATADGDTRALCIARRALWRGGVAHERAKGHSVGCKCGRRSPATKDEDATIDAAQDAGWQVDGVNDCTEDMCPKCQRARLTAPGEGTNEATVRQERCLVAQAVAADCDIHVTEQISGMWCVRVVAQTSSTAAGVSATVPRADAPSTLARLLGEVSRG